MNRSTSVTISAVLMLVGSVLALGSGATLLTALLLAPVSAAVAAPPFGKTFLVFVAAMYMGVGAWGATTAAGLFRLRSWARVSILVFAGMLISFAGCGLGVTLFVPLPIEGGAAHPAVRGLWTALSAVYSLLVALGAWWLYLFNTAAVKKEFLKEAPRSPVA